MLWRNVSAPLVSVHHLRRSPITAELNDDVAAEDRVNHKRVILKREIIQDERTWTDELTDRGEVFGWLVRYNNCRRPTKTATLPRFHAV